MFRTLRIFICSTGDLGAERDAVERVLDDLSIEGSRFEAWPSSPRSPVSECLSQIDDSDALVLILGSRYGSLASDSSLSVTHLEYRHARSSRIPVFPFLLAREDIENAQRDFVEEVQEANFRCSPVQTAAELASQVKNSLLAEFVRCFRESHSPPPPGFVESRPRSLPADPTAALAFLEDAFSRQDDLAIHAVAEECEQRFGSEARILEVIYATEVDLALRSSQANSQRVKRAIQFWEDQHPESVEARALLKYNQGNALHALGLLGEARKAFDDSRRLYPRRAETWKNLGNVLFDLDRKEEAYECFDTAIELNPELAEGLQSLGVIAMQAGNYSKAIALLERAPTEGLGPDRTSHLSYWRALAYAEAGRMDEAIGSVDTCIRLTPEEDWAWRVGARVHALARFHSSDYIPRTVAFFRRLVSAMPYSADGWAELGFSLSAAHRVAPENDSNPEEIVEAFNRAIDLGFEDDGLVLDRLAHLYETLGAREEAERFFRQAASKSPDPFGLCLGSFLLKVERFSEALPYLLEMSETRPEDSTIWNRLGLCYSGLDRFDESIEAYSWSITLDQSQANSWFNLGGIYRNEGKVSEARRVWTSSLELFPDHELAEQTRGILDAPLQGD